MGKLLYTATRLEEGKEEEEQEHQGRKKSARIRRGEDREEAGVMQGGVRG